ncbi:hypothetical protein PspLS_11919, partial [Pyricularia sp. CBS 133598]
SNTTIFSNNVQQLVAIVFPHPLLQTLDEIHVCWQGQEKPAPRDLPKLLAVRRPVVEHTLCWLKTNNPLCSHITIDTAKWIAGRLRRAAYPRFCILVRSAVSRGVGKKCGRRRSYPAPSAA